jgi:protein gp37
MADKSRIEWTEATWNPTTGCDRVSPGCDHCYAMSLAPRLKAMGSKRYQRDGDPRTSGPGFGLTVHPDALDLPLRWTKPRRIFVNSMSDLFHDEVPDWFIAEVFGVMARAPQHTFQLLTKRHGRMRSLLGGDGVRLLDAAVNEVTAQALYDQWPVPNVWLGVSVEDQKWADIRIPALLDTPAAVRWLSMEPLLGPVDLNRTDKDTLVDGGIDWVVVGGESGRNARPMDADWARMLRDRCVSAGVPFFFKQWGEHVVRDQMSDDAFHAWDAKYGSDVYDPSVQWRIGKKAAGRELDGRTWDEYPAVTA